MKIHSKQQVANQRADYRHNSVIIHSKRDCPRSKHDTRCGHTEFSQCTGESDQNSNGPSLIARECSNHSLRQDDGANEDSGESRKQKAGK